MILIISQTHEQTTDRVIDWINYYGKSFTRINGVDFYKGIDIKILNSDFSVDLDNLNWDDVKVVWYRRWIGFENRHEYLLKQQADLIDPLKYQLNQFIREELKMLVEFFFNSIPKEKLFEQTKTGEINKLIVLKKAAELGITIPDTYILTSRDNLVELSGKNRLITKAIANGPAFQVSDESYLGYTALIGELPGVLDKRYSASLFQAYVEKKFEIRAFLLCGKFYSMAIFSQSDPQTSVDFRKYNYKRPNRTVPYQLPSELEEKLKALADFFELKTGSFDIIKTVDNQYVFLEINPGGQFGMVSYPCNYHLEKKVAIELINFECDAI